ncbi:MAG: succinylglutamate desuccinylase/aspartoacylase family protein [Candidatus Nitrotoga sp.]|nr:MAG: succinylglutamate desuccinylase/aspartoacylase family protein [Candidatus Saccharibacteria bacterium]
MKILILAATHGNELLGPKLIEYMLRKHPSLFEYIEFIVANPRALAKRIRYTESDLNRSYGLGTDTYEQRRANDIEAHIKATQPDIVLDMHTTACVQPPIMIVGNITNATVRAYLRNCHISTVLQVKPLHDIATITPSIVAYEIMNRDVTTNVLEQICEDLNKFLNNKVEKKVINLYRMSDKIYKRDITAAQAKTFKNFEMNELGFIPIMTGNNSYKKQTDYLGFKSAEPIDLVL